MQKRKIKTLSLDKSFSGQVFWEKEIKPRTFDELYRPFKHNKVSLDVNNKTENKYHKQMSFYGTKVNGLFDSYNNIMTIDNNM